MNWKSVAVAMTVVIVVVSRGSAAPNRELVFIGGGRGNIESYRFDPASGALNRIHLAARLIRPSFFAITPDRRFLYSISEGEDESHSSVSAFAINAGNDTLTRLNSRPAGGVGPCHLSLDAAAKYVLIANYPSGSAAVFPIAPNGSLNPMSALVQDHGSSVNPDRQTGPHAHCIVTDPADHFALLCDLGADKVMIYKFDPANGTLQPNDPAFVTAKPGTGPRHVAFHPNGRWAYVSDELGNAVTAYSWDPAAGSLREIQSESTLPAGFTGANTVAEVAVHPSGKFVFVSNRGFDSIAVFACDPDTGHLTPLERDRVLGRTPRQFEIDPSGTWLLAGNEESDSVTVFRIDKSSGHLQLVGHPVHAPAPVCIKFLPP